MDAREYVVVVGERELWIATVEDLALLAKNGWPTIREVWYYGGWRANRTDVIPSMRLATLKYELKAPVRNDRGQIVQTVHHLVVFDRQGEEIDRAEYRLEV